MSTNHLINADTRHLCEDLEYQTSPGVHTYGEAACGHFGRGCRTCAWCLDWELQRRGIDVTRMYWGVVYKRDKDGKLTRSERAGWIDRATGEMVEVKGDKR